MNNTFELKRFGLLFKKLLFERALHLVGSFVLVALVTWFFHTVMDIGYDVNNVVPASNAFAIGLVLGGIYWVFTGFSYFSNNTEGYSYLTLPASHLEKWLSAILLLGFFMLFFCIYFRVLDTIYLHKFLADKVNWKNYPKILETAYPLAFWGDKRIDLEGCYSAFFNATGVMAVGSLYFNKNAFIKTTLITLVFFISLTILNMKVASALFNDSVALEPLWRSADIYSINFHVQLSEPINTAYMLGFDYLLPVALWLIALVRLREKEL